MTEPQRRRSKPPTTCSTNQSDSGRTARHYLESSVCQGSRETLTASSQFGPRTDRNPTCCHPNMYDEVYRTETKISWHHQNSGAHDADTAPDLRAVPLRRWTGCTDLVVLPSLPTCQLSPSLHQFGYRLTRLSTLAFSLRDPQNPTCPARWSPCSLPSIGLSSLIFATMIGLI